MCVCVYVCIGLVSLGHCECAKARQQSSLACSGHGALVFGRCECYEPYAGHRCHNNLDSMSQNDDACHPGSNDPVCSNRGSCVEGFCECNQRENPDEKYSEDTVSALTLTVRNGKTGRMKGWYVFLMLKN